MTHAKVSLKKIIQILEKGHQQLATLINKYIKLQITPFQQMHTAN